MFGRSSAGALAARRPYVVKLTADPAFERSRRRGLVGGDVDEFQSGGGGGLGFALRRARNFELRRAAHVYCPSAYLRKLALSWGLPPERVSVLPNPVPVLPPIAERDELRRELGLNRATLAFAGRLTAQKSLTRALDAVAAADGVELVIAGDGPDRETLEQYAQSAGIADRVRFLGAQPRHRIVELFRAADASILSSSWENFPHTIVEALSVVSSTSACWPAGTVTTRTSISRRRFRRSTARRSSRRCRCASRASSVRSVHTRCSRRVRTRRPQRWRVANWHASTRR